MCDFKPLNQRVLAVTLAFYNERVHGMSHVIPCVVFLSVVYRTVDVTVYL